VVRLDLAELAREHYEMVYRFCARQIGNDRAADAAQETFVTAQRVLNKYRGESTVRTWLLGIAYNECRRLIRMRRAECVPIDLVAEPASPDPSSSWVDRDALRRALAGLSQEHREVVLLHEIEGLTYDEIAVVAGVPAGTVKSRLHHAFMNMRRTLRPEAE
jgi:RNA polymerase sigma-70 factor (ECF subfamily)